MNATEYFQKRHKWAQALRVRDIDVPAEVVWAFPDTAESLTDDQIRSARQMVKSSYLDR